MENSEHCNKSNAFAVEYCMLQEEPLILRIKEWITKVRQRVKSTISHSSPLSIDSQYHPTFMAFFLLAEKILHFNDETVESYFKGHTINVHNIQWAAEADLQNEKNLWALSCRASVDGSLANYENILSACFDTLAHCRSHVLLLMLWLFPKIATQERVKVAVDLASEENSPLLLRDRMLAWLICLNNENYSKERVRDIEVQVRKLVEELDVVATSDGKGVDGDSRLYAIGLLLLISCVRRNNSEDSAGGELPQSAHRIVEHLMEVCEPDEQSPDIGWAYYALCEYVNLFR